MSPPSLSGSGATGTEAIYRGMPRLDTAGPPLSLFETWPPWIFYLPVALHWAWLSLRHGSATLPTIANPCLEAGGLCGESKSATLAQLGPEGRRWLAPFTTIVTADRSDGRDLAAAAAAIAAAGLDFPLVAKPDIGCHGSGVRVVATAGELAAYLAAFPRGERVILQRLVPHDGEAGIFYARRPGEPTGRIISLTLKYFPFVVGDGRSTLRQLIAADPRAGRLAKLYLARHARRLDDVLPAGDVFRLAFVGNHCKGAIFRNGASFMTPALAARFDAIAREMPEFYFGRFDVRFPSLAGLQDGTDFAIVEFNGAGSEAIHIWDRQTSLAAAYRALREQYALAFEIGARNRARGFTPTPTFELMRLLWRQQSLMRRHPAEQ